MKDGFLCLAPGMGTKLMFRMSRVRGRGILAIGHHPQEDGETTQRLACDQSPQGCRDSRMGTRNIEGEVGSDLSGEGWVRGWCQDGEGRDESWLVQSLPVTGT